MIRAEYIGGAPTPDLEGLARLLREKKKSKLSPQNLISYSGRGQREIQAKESACAKAHKQGRP